jgi:hypothetical protein
MFPVRDELYFYILFRNPSLGLLFHAFVSSEVNFSGFVNKPESSCCS